MGSFIKAYADAHDLADGDAISLSFGDLRDRYLERSRDVLIRDYQAQTTRHRLTDNGLGHAGV
ncbi:MAG: hypothetical protein HLUCCA11_21545 [Phormidesmis priestleyi Ana]|uniref:Uncharacterized protein n=1 Tax=Phormidesmis priestleyi Ana TaxID=1666911 RepID=A0A0P8BUE2_9CYAN|nr:MAG: hypothetical protein HLUCCA11_21545 [Phormidesmis priestleyi Ana]